MNIPGIDTESEYTHSGDVAPKEPSSVKEISETMNRVFMNVSSSPNKILSIMFQ